MASKREFGFEKQSGDFNERTGLQNGKAGKPENVDALVSRFLAELSDLSSEVNQDGSHEAGAGIESGSEEAKPDSPFALQKWAAARPDQDLEWIDREIEDSLTQLEDIKPAVAPPEESPSPDAAMIPSTPPATPEIESAVEQPAPRSQADPEEQAWDRLELFRKEVAKSRTIPHSSIRWVLAGAVLIGILGVLGFHYFTSDSRLQNPAKNRELAPTEVKTPPAASESTPPIVDNQKNDKSIAPAKTAVLENNKSRAVPRNGWRNADTGTGRGNGSAGGLEVKPAEKTNKDSAPENAKLSEEPAKPVPVPVAVPATPSPQPPPVLITPAASPQPKAPTPPAEIGSTTPPANGSAEIAPPAPKPALPSNGASDVAAQTVARTALLPEAIKKVPPVYPALARARRISGKVDVEAEINDNGDVFRAKAVSGPEMLRAAAEEALMKWKFKPASVGGVNVSSKARIAVNFNLQ